MNNRIKQAFAEVRAQDTLKQRTKAYLEKRMQRMRPNPAHVRRLAACACIAVLLLGFGGWRLHETPVSAISVDVNPSIELGVNRFDRVVSVTGYHEDGEALAAAVNLKNLPYAEALDTLFTSDAMYQYLGGDALVSITVIGSTDAKSEEMRACIAACDYAASPKVECQSGNREEAAAAHAVGLSFGKYRAFLTLHALDEAITVDDIRGLTMRQIRNWIAELSGAPDTVPDGHAAHGQGNDGDREEGRHDGGRG